MFNWVGDLLFYVYYGISWILLRWHDFWNWALPDGVVLGTTFEWVLAIVFLVLTVRIVLFPLFVKQIKSQRAMQALQPQVKALQEKHKGDRETLQREMMELYRKEKANPLMGCLPLLLQLPVFFGMFHILRRIDPFQKLNTTLYGWTQVQWDSAVEAKLFGAPIGSTFLSSAQELAAMGASSVTVKIVAAVLAVIMIVTTYLTSRQMILKTGWAEDPTQLMMQRLMVYGIPVSLMFSAGYFPIGVVIYWTITNLFSLGQQYWVLHKYPPPKVNGKTVATAASAAKSGTGKAGSKAGGKVSIGKGKDAAKNGEQPQIDGKALAPKPGVKPVNAKKSSRKRKARR
ncbi:MAG: membrane protein insertase YidC [Micromonosporaceae bacterium]